MLLQQLRPAIVSLLGLTLVTGVAYPLLVTGIAQAAFPDKANGSLVQDKGVVVGSSLIGQPWGDAKYFWGRLSATSSVTDSSKAQPYNGAASTGSNLGPTNPALAEQAATRIKALQDSDPTNADALPVDLVTASGSGLDPDISPASALYQVRRVARARGLDEARVQSLVQAQVHGRELGIFGEPRVNVLELNLALDALR